MKKYKIISIDGVEDYSHLDVVVSCGDEKKEYSFPWIYKNRLQVGCDFYVYHGRDETNDETVRAISDLESSAKKYAKKVADNPNDYEAARIHTNLTKGIESLKKLQAEHAKNEAKFKAEHPNSDMGPEIAYSFDNQIYMNFLYSVDDIDDAVKVWDRFKPKDALRFNAVVTRALVLHGKIPTPAPAINLLMAQKLPVNSEKEKWEITKQTSASLRQAIANKKQERLGLVHGS